MHPVTLPPFDAVDSPAALAGGILLALVAVAAVLALPYPDAQELGLPPAGPLQTASAAALAVAAVRRVLLALGGVPLQPRRLRAVWAADALAVLLATGATALFDVSSLWTASSVGALAHLAATAGVAAAGPVVPEPASRPRQSPAGSAAGRTAEWLATPSVLLALVLSAGPWVAAGRLPLVHTPAGTDLTLSDPALADLAMGSAWLPLLLAYFAALAAWAALAGAALAPRGWRPRALSAACTATALHACALLWGGALAALSVGAGVLTPGLFLLALPTPLAFAVVALGNRLGVYPD